MVGGLSGMAVNCQVTSLAAAPRTVAAPASLMTKRRSSVPLALLLCAPEAGSARSQPGREDGGAAGIGRGAHQSLDAEIARHHPALPIEAAARRFMRSPPAA